MKKFLALILSLALIFSTVCTGLVTFASESNSQANPEYYWEPVDAIGYDEDQIDIRGTNADVALTAEEIAASKPRLVAGGVNGSNAMQVGGSYTYSRYLMHFRINGLKLDTTYVIKMDVKKVSGAIRNMQAGVWRTGAYNYSSTTYANADISSDAFTTLTFESSLSGSYIPYYLIVNFNTTSAGAVLLIDNIVVYEKDDTTQTNLYDTSLAVETGSENSGTFDKGYKLWFDNAVEENLCYFPITSIPYRTSGTANVVPALSNMGEGVKGSYAMKLDTPASKQATLYLQPASTIAYSHSTEYVIEMKIKKSAGSISANNLLIGMNEGGWNWSKTITDAELSGEYTYFKWTHTTNATTGWRYLCFRYTAGSSGATLLVDDIKVYKASDANKTPIVFQNGLEADCDFELDQTYYKTPVDNSAVEGIAYTAASTIGDKVSGSNASSYDAAIAPEIVEGGVKGSYAMQIGGATEGAISGYTVTFAGQNFTPGKAYTVELDINKVSGTVTSLWMGMNASTGALTLADANLSNSFATYKWTITTNATITTSTWMYFQLKLEALAGGATLLIDNIKIYPVEDIAAPTYAAAANNGNFTFDASEQMLPVYKETAPTDEVSFFEPSSNKANPVDSVDTTNVAELVCLENAHSGSYAIAIGASNNNPTNATVRFGLKELNFGKTYKVKFAAFIVGSFNLFNASVTPTNGASDVYEVQISKNSAESDVPRYWKEFEFTFTNTATLKDYVSPAYMLFTFVDTLGEAALFIDSVSVCEIDAEGNAVGPNIFSNGGFEYNTVVEPDWSQSNFWSGDSSTDFTFMQYIEKELGGLGTGIVNDTDLFNTLLTDAKYEEFDSYIVNGSKYDVALYEATKLAEANKKVWLGVTDILNDGKNVDAQWQTKLIRYATMLQEVCGDNFQGFYFDEPAYYCTSEEFITITKFCREHFRKRVFANHFSATFVSEETNENIKFIASADNHTYVTDVGYWRYGSWDNTAASALTVWKNFVDTLNENTRIWITPLLGRHDYLQTESDVLDILNNLLEGFRDIDNFGGVLFYSMSYQPEIVELNDEKFNQAIADGTLQPEYYTVLDKEGNELYYRYFRGGGAYVIDENNEDYMPQVAAVVNQIAKEFNADSAFRLNEKCGTYAIVNGVIYVEETGVTAADLISASGLDDIASTSIFADTAISLDSLVGTDYALTSDFITTEFSYKIAVKNDANGDGEIDIIDLVRAIKLSKQVITGTDAQYIALDAFDGDVSAETLTVLRKFIFNK